MAVKNEQFRLLQARMMLTNPFFEFSLYDDSGALIGDRYNKQYDGFDVSLDSGTGLAKLSLRNPIYFSVPANVKVNKLRIRVGGNTIDGGVFGFNLFGEILLGNISETNPFIYSILDIEYFID